MRFIVAIAMVTMLMLLGMMFPMRITYGYTWYSKDAVEANLTVK